MTIRSFKDSDSFWDRVTEYPVLITTARAVFISGAINTNVIDYVAVETLGNAINFGDLEYSTESNGGASSSTRGLSAGGEVSGVGRSNIIEYITIASTGNGTDFGDLQAGAYWVAGASNNTRALFGTGSESGDGDSSRMSYVTIATTGNATTFGTVGGTGRTRGMGSAASDTRALFCGGAAATTSTFQNDIVYFTIATTGDSTDFGDLTVARAFMSNGGCSPTRALFAGGNSGSNTNTIDYITIASTGNATDFGDLTFSAQCATTSSHIRAVHARNVSTNQIDFTTISTTGNGTDFGDLTVIRTNGMAAVSSGHGGISG